MSHRKAKDRAGISIPSSPKGSAPPGLGDQGWLLLGERIQGQLKHLGWAWEHWHQGHLAVSNAPYPKNSTNATFLNPSLAPALGYCLSNLPVPWVTTDQVPIFICQHLSPPPSSRISAHQSMNRACD